MPFRGGEGTLSSRGCCARSSRCVPGEEGDGNSLWAWLVALNILLTLLNMPQCCYICSADLFSLLGTSLQG